MNKSTVMFLVIIALVVLFFYSTTTDNFEPNESVQSHEPGKTALSQSAIEADSLHIPVTIKETREINEFNEFLINQVSPLGYSNKDSLLANIQNTIDHDNIDVAALELKKVLEDPQEHQLIIRELETSCHALRKREVGQIDEIQHSMVKAELFLLALQQSNFCTIYGTENDPFYITLNLARKGDKLAQLFLYEDLLSAMNRQLVSPALFPIEYNDLRQEVIGYLNNLSSQGVSDATIKLANIFSDNAIVPYDNFYRYYYTFLAEKQTGERNTFFINSDELFDRLTYNEKLRAERLVKKLQ
jgi:hypothetical protein